MLGARADRRRDYGLSTVVVLLAAGSVGFALMATDAVPSFVAGALLAFTLGWGWPGLFNLAVVDSNRRRRAAPPASARPGIYVGAGGGPAAFGALYARRGTRPRGSWWPDHAARSGRYLARSPADARSARLRNSYSIRGFDLSGPGITQTQPPGPVFGTYGFPRPCPGILRSGPDHGIRARRFLGSERSARQRPAKSGSRFSKNARAPSAKSSDAASVS